MTYPALPTDGVHALTYNNGPVVINSPQNFVGQSGAVLLPGDFSQDNMRSVADVSAMMNALADLARYQTSNALSQDQMNRLADFSGGSGAITNADLQALINLLANSGGSGSLTPVPEPPTFALAALGAISSLAARRRFNRNQIGR